MKNRLIILFAFTSVIGKTQVDPAPCTDLFISEYIEGTSNNKALELYNPTSVPINLTNYSIKIYFNGSTVSGATFLPQGIIGAGQTFTIANSSSTIFTSPLPDTTAGGVSIVSFNGDDAVELIHGTAVIDVIGIVGTDPGTNWVVGIGATSEFTLVRKSSVHNGYNVWLGSGDTTFDVFPQNTTTFFGSHSTAACPALPLTADFDFTTVCSGNNTDFTNTTIGGTPGFMYAWDFGDASGSALENPSHFFGAPGCYTVQLIVTDTLLNKDTIVQVVCVTPLDDPLITTADTILCNDSFGMFLNSDDTTGGTWSGTFVSDSGGGNGFFSSAAIAPGTYYAVYTTNGTCPNADSVNITVPTPPTAGFTYTNTGLDFNFTSTATGATTYMWDFNGAGTSSAVNPSFTFSGAGTYNVCLMVTSLYGCEAVFCQNIVITSTNEIESAASFTLFPNPSTGILTLKGKVNTSVEIRNTAGQLIYSGITQQENTTIDLHHVPDGVYTIIAGNKVSKLILMK